MRKIWFTILISVFLSVLAAPALAQFEGCDIQRHNLKDWKWLIYDADLQYLLLLEQDYKPRIINSYCSYPAVAPAKDKFALLEPWDFEETSGIYLYQAGDNYAEAGEIIIPAISERNTPKEIAWLDDHNLLVIAGFVDGTITRGGNLFYYNDISGRSGKIIACQNMEIAQIKLDKDAGKAYLYMAGPEYDSRFTIARDFYTEEVDIDKLERLIAEDGLIILNENPARLALLPIVYDLAWFALWPALNMPKPAAPIP